MKYRPMVAVLVPILYLCSCADKAKPDFERGVEEEDKGHFPVAIAAYELAKTVDPQSKAGLEAATRLDTLRARLQKEAEDEAARKKVEEERRDAGRVLKENPTLPFVLEPSWLVRIHSFLRNEPDDVACPQLKNTTGVDELERQASKERALAECKAENERALDYLKTCPFSTALTVGMTVREYDFSRHVFAIRDEPSEKSLIATSGRVWLHRRLLVTWTGPYAARTESGDAAVRSGELCRVNAKQAEDLLDAFRLDIPMSAEDAETLKAKLATSPPAFDKTEASVEVALLLDGGTAADTFSCGGKPSVLSPTGKVAAWRLVAPSGPLTDWKGTGVLDLPSSCEDARKLLAKKSDSSISSDKSCACGLTPAFHPFFQEVGRDTADFYPSKSDVTNAKTRLALLSSELQSRSGCAADPPDAKARMVKYISLLQQAAAAWEEVHLSEAPAKLGKARAASRTVHAAEERAYTRGPATADNPLGSIWFNCAPRQ